MDLHLYDESDLRCCRKRACLKPSVCPLLTQLFSFSLPLQNSIRHNLSLHSRFVRVQNEGTGKSSWWMLNPEGGKSGKSPRRRAASMDNNSKFTKSRGRAAKKKVTRACVVRKNSLLIYILILLIFFSILVYSLCMQCVQYLEIMC